MFMFDAPGATEKAVNWLAVVLLLTYPATIYIGVGITKSAHENNRTLHSLVGLAVSYSNFAVLFILLKWFI
ncbi:hypothetical protein AT746_19440 [Lacimicrobium alkaliphilum]|uniref:Uncharacterized protein n=1 Tax=Lacimicrobium alkaliphilum TaxID=1526571 RepID=A0A0U2PKR4_9ALTE|nr:hypothetical protein AT746_19440 [Lacimicrobium alkaliphilum]